MKHHIPSLQQVVHGSEDAIITLSGPALAISGIIAGVDLVTGGHAMQNLPGLTLAWAICLLLTLDFQVLALGARAHQIYLSPTSERDWRRKLLEIALAVIVAAAISYVSIQMQSIIARVNSGVPGGLTIDQAASQLGINSLALIWERSALVLVLIFLSGWFRGEHEGEHQQAQATITPAQAQAQAQAAMTTITPETITALIEQVVTRVTITMQAQQLQQQSGQFPAITAHRFQAGGKQGEDPGIAELSTTTTTTTTDDQAERLDTAYRRLREMGIPMEEISAHQLRQDANVRAEIVAPWLRGRIRQEELELEGLQQYANGHEALPQELAQGQPGSPS